MWDIYLIGRFILAALAFLWKALPFILGAALFFLEKGLRLFVIIPLAVVLIIEIFRLGSCLYGRIDSSYGDSRAGYNRLRVLFLFIWLLIFCMAYIIWMIWVG